MFVRVLLLSCVMFLIDGMNTSDADAKCGVVSVANDLSSLNGFINLNSTKSKIRKPRSVSSNYPSPFPPLPHHYIELHLVVDSLVYRRFQGDEARVKSFCAETISFTNALFTPLGITLVLKQLEIWRSTDKTHVSSSHSETLENFEIHRYNLLVKGVNSDVTVLLTNINFDGSTVGYALVDSMCSLNAIATVQSYGKNPSDVSHTLAHELGHVLGMDHDDNQCECPEKTCIMAASLSNSLGARVPWSDCSHKKAINRLTRGHFPCLDNPPAVSERDRIPFCGNGVLDEGEACDCGPKGFCTNSCCDPETCRLTDGAQCAMGACCDLKTCTLAPPAVECRSRQSECDLPEYCPGNSQNCPDDVSVENGTPCDDQKAHCFGGKCGSPDLRCGTVFGEGAVRATDRCFRNNGRGKPGMNCGMYRDSVTYKRCSEGSLTCGSLYCKPPVGTQTTVLKLTTWRLGKCYTAFAANITMSPELELTPDGAPCGDGKMCMSQECVPIPVTRCVPDSCGSHGTCNSNGNCHCNSGVDPPSCTVPGYGGSVDSGPSEYNHAVEKAEDIILLIFLSVLPLLLLFISLIISCNVWWEKKGKENKMRNFTATKLMNTFCFCNSNYIAMKMDDIGGTVGNMKQPLNVQVLTSSHQTSPQQTSVTPIRERSQIVKLKKPLYLPSMSMDSGIVSETDSGIVDFRVVRPPPLPPTKYIPNSKAIHNSGKTFNGSNHSWKTSINSNNPGGNSPNNGNNIGWKTSLNSNNPGGNSPKNGNNIGWNTSLNSNNPGGNSPKNGNNIGWNTSLNSNNPGGNSSNSGNKPSWKTSDNTNNPSWKTSNNWNNHSGNSPNNSNNPGWKSSINNPSGNSPNVSNPSWKTSKTSSPFGNSPQSIIHNLNKTPSVHTVGPKTHNPTSWQTKPKPLQLPPNLPIPKTKNVAGLPKVDTYKGSNLSSANDFKFSKVENTSKKKAMVPPSTWKKV